MKPRKRPVSLRVAVGVGEDLSDGDLVLYGITSGYMEDRSKDSQLVDFGYNRDGKKGHEQIVVGLLCSKEGCPVGAEVFPGNTKDSTTVMGKIAELQGRYSLKKIIFVGDRGMLASGNIEKPKDIGGLATISALPHPQIYALIGRKVFQAGLSDGKRIAEVIDPEDVTVRYCLCRNPETGRRETATRSRLPERRRVELDKIAASSRKSSPEKLGLNR